VQIDELRIIVTEQKKNVAVASEECEAMLVTIESSTQKANVKKAEASEKSVEVEIKGKQIAIEKDEAEEILAEAMPALEEARLALSQLEKAQITEIRSFATPPAAVQVVCECVAILKGYKEINWKSAKGMMSSSLQLPTIFTNTIFHFLFSPPSTLYSNSTPGKNPCHFHQTKCCANVGHLLPEMDNCWTCDVTRVLGQHHL